MEADLDNHPSSIIKVYQGQSSHSSGQLINNLVDVDEAVTRIHVPGKEHNLEAFHCLGGMGGLPRRQNYTSLASVAICGVTPRHSKPFKQTQKKPGAICCMLQHEPILNTHYQQHQQCSNHPPGQGPTVNTGQLQDGFLGFSP